MRLLSALILSSVTLVTGCGHHGGKGSATPLQMEARAEKLVIRVHGVDGNIFRFAVENLTGDTMVINRDATHIQTPQGPRERLPAMGAHEYTLLPHAVLECDIRFPLEGIPGGSQVAVDFNGAITANGQPVASPPIPFTMK